MMTTLVSGLVALALTGTLWAYLRVRVRHLRQGAEFLEEFGQLARHLSELEMPDRQLENVVLLAQYTGTGHIARRLFRQLATGDLAALPSRDAIAARRKVWRSFHSSTRLLYVRTFFAAIRADSYFAGVITGTLFRRAVFYLNADPAEIAKALDAFETKVLMLGAERAVEREDRRRHQEPDDHDKVLART